MKKINKRKAEKIVNKRIKKCVREIYDYESSFNSDFQYRDIYKYLRGEILTSWLTTETGCMMITEMLEIKKEMKETDEQKIYIPIWRENDSAAFLY